MKRHQNPAVPTSPEAKLPTIRQVDGMRIKTHVKAAGGRRNANHPSAYLAIHRSTQVARAK